MRTRSKSLRCSSGFAWILVCVSFIGCNRPGLGDDTGHPLPGEQRESLKTSLHQQIEAASTAIDSHPDSVDLYSRRGDAYFFAGKFAEAVQDYDRMVAIDAQQDASHWRRGIAYFYAGEYDKGADQFTRYNSFDNVDRENGIWRYLCQYKAKGKEAARTELLKYEKDDREPFGDVYRLFSGELGANEVIERIKAKNLSATEREKQLFYAELYVGLNELVEGRPESARTHLRAATANTWGPKAGYGPSYMWHVGRLQYELLETAEKQPPN